MPQGQGPLCRYCPTCVALVPCSVSNGGLALAAEQSMLPHLPALMNRILTARLQSHATNVQEYKNTEKTGAYFKKQDPPVIFQ